MPKCEFCGKEHDDNSFELYATAKRSILEGFENASQDIRHVCEHCQCRVIGGGVKVGGHVYCCADCALFATSADVKGRPV
jgi:hypothetical protein